MGSELQRLKRDTETGRVITASSGTVAAAQESGELRSAGRTNASVPTQGSQPQFPAQALPPHTSAAVSTQAVSSLPSRAGVPAPHGLWRYIGAGVLVAALVAGGLYYRSRQHAAHALTEKDTIVLADFSCRPSLRLAPDSGAPYADLGNRLISLQRFDETRQIIHEAQTRKVDNVVFRNVLYALAFLGSDSAAMAEEEQWYAGKPEENMGLALASDTEAYGGHLGKTRELTKRAVDSAILADSKETGAIWQENAAIAQAAYGNPAEARQSTAEALKLAPTSQGVEVEAALGFALAGDTARAESMAQDLGKRFPLDTQMQSLWLPAIQAQLALDKKSPAAALTALQAASPIELGQINFVANISCLYHVYIRGEAYLASGQGKEAAAEFQKIIDHSGIVWNCWTGALARLGVARANALQARNSSGADAARVRALAAYKDFLALWKDADSDIPVFKRAQAEYAKLQ